MKNRYFDRVVQAYLSGCLFGDPWLMARVMGQELQNLRKHHNRFLGFMQALTRYGYDLFSGALLPQTQAPSPLEGIRVFVKGRVTLGTRQLRRKFGKWMLMGQMGFSQVRNHLLYGDDVAITRFGIVSIKVWLRYHRSGSVGLSFVRP